VIGLVALRANIPVLSLPLKLVLILCHVKKDEWEMGEPVTLSRESTALDACPFSRLDEVPEK
jgi:hypothetical protein